MQPPLNPHSSLPVWPPEDEKKTGHGWSTIRALSPSSRGEENAHLRLEARCRRAFLSRGASIGGLCDTCAWSTASCPIAQRFRPIARNVLILPSLNDHPTLTFRLSFACLFFPSWKLFFFSTSLPVVFFFFFRFCARNIWTLNNERERERERERQWRFLR